MRSMIIVLLLSAALAGVWAMKSRSEQPPVAPKTSQTSEHNWAKNALDRTAELKQQVAQQRKEDGTR